MARNAPLNHPAGLAGTIRRQRDLRPGASVEAYVDGTAKWGEVQKLNEAPGSVKYQVANTETGEVSEVAAIRLKPVNDGDELKVGTAVRATPFRQTFDAVVKNVVQGPTRQDYDVMVQWEQGWQVPEAYLEPGVPEADVEEKDSETFRPGEVKKRATAEIEHFRPGGQDESNAGEYIKPQGKIDITSHALGSGIYGVADATHEIKTAAGKLGPYTTEKIRIDNPLVVQNALHGQELQELGKRVNGIAQRYHDTPEGERGEVSEHVAEDSEELLKLMTRVFGRAGFEPPPLADVTKALSIFADRYAAPESKFIDQPMTIFLAELCKFGGVYGDGESGLNSYQKGSVKFVPHDQEMPRKTRDGFVHQFVK
ncbi:hypothetical protein [Nakamurella panacisegetis]|uniref:hypothetical protein n=1 Tax=Nakamurella panacisegetis TaxID=1090615 RepID=UPI0012FDC2C4|nr:hypothetical protein [Nakamurella panacisegetis]